MKGEKDMWYVYNIQDSWQLGWVVESEKVAKEFCKNNPEYTYIYVG